MRNLRAMLLLSSALLGLSGCSPAKDEVASSNKKPNSKLVLKEQNGEIKVTITVNRTNLSTSESLELSLNVLAPKNLEVILPRLREKLDSFMLADEYFDAPQSNADQVSYCAEWVLYPAMPGKLTFPPLEIQLGTNSFLSKPILFQVQSVLPPGTKNAPLLGMAPPEKLLAEQKARRAFLRILLLSALTGMLLIFIPWLLLKLRKRRPLKPHEKALLALEKLPEDPAACLHALHHILRTYIAERWALDLDGKTDQELLSFLQNEELDGEKEAALHFFSQVEAARFSHCIPEELPQKAESTLRVFIEKTFELKEETS